ncbi:unnamed protein product [Paramecium sonneborni]|uniref:Uncharacterized protein n=1 Tax=Paramecium sonneborni TaxID=65129 RepID=A0A8S1JXA1_9CILI|nr:unnamed protein product [Paramecium sonneborni]
MNSHLLKNDQLHCNQFRQKVIKFIVQLNMAKMKYQLGFYGKAFILAEQAMSTLEKELFDRLKNRDSKIEDAMLLINGYMILAKSYESSSDIDLQYIHNKSLCQEDQIQKFYLNAKQLTIKYLGSNNQIIQKLQYSSSHRLKKPKIQQPTIQLISRQQLNQIIQLFKLVKRRINIVIQPEKPHYRRCLKGSIDTYKTTSTQNSQMEISKPYIKKFRVRCKQNSNHEGNSSDETTKEKVINCDTPISYYKQLESVILKKVEEQLNIKLQSKKSELELSNLEDQKKLLEQNQKITNLYDQIQLLKDQLKEKDLLQEQQQIQIELLQANNKKQSQSKIKSVQSPIKKNTSINEFQISSEQKEFFIQSAIKTKRNEINEFNIDQTPIKLVNSLNGEFQTPDNKNSIAEFQTNKKSTPPFSFSFHKHQQQSIEQPLTPPPNITQENTLDQSQQWPTQKLQNVSIIEFEESINFSFTYQSSQEYYSIQLQPNEIYMIQVENELSYIVEISLVSNKANPKLEDFCLLIQININSQRVSELIEINSLADMLQHTNSNICIPFPLKYITSYKLFIQYLVIPFIQISIENLNYKIAMYSLPPGLFTNYQCINLFGDPCEWAIYFLDNYKFKVVIFQNKTYIQDFEIVFDQLTFDEYFEYLNYDQYIQQEMENILNSIKKIQSSSQNYFKLPNVKIRDKEKLINFINNCLLQIGILITERNQRDLKHYLKENIVSINLDIFDKFKIRASLIQQINGRIDLILKNFYQTHLTQNELGFANSSIQITDEFIQDKFHIDFFTLDEHEKKFILKRISNYFSLFTYTSLQDGNDLDWKNENPIQSIDQDFGGTHKIMLAKQYRTPICFTLIGIHNKPEFIRVDMYDTEKIQQNGILLFINEEQWKKRESPSPTKKSKHYKYNKEFAIQEKYYLYQILQEAGWKVIEKCIVAKNDISISLEGKIYRLEQFLNLKSIQEN